MRKTGSGGAEVPSGHEAGYLSSGFLTSVEDGE